ncbi:hypothetical protein EHC08_23650, partial [Salmonella enterica subsp. enterica serovar Schwarzengrund]|nr:hypothetical protein [Salmonella enterica]EAS8366052.1 hypothetical protein [Salmonella enterica subsp. enterica]EBZ8750830.1 hypothetical protein [Salmonella enterica subsp. enterica serovar Schwarzengrund]ECU2301426.1 hypothetical protein [Salmonella enterica subsp. enterica serovar Schwarzengrund]ECV4697090.1 hypothetical protein [Salmonella enterica subsp. enterica serovar Schwarzengrund]
RDYKYNKVLNNLFIFVKSKSELFTSLLNTISRIFNVLKSNQIINLCIRSAYVEQLSASR